MSVYIWDGFSDFQAPHQKLFDFNSHTWTNDFLRLAGQPLLCFGIEWSGSRRHGGWGSQYHLAYWGKESERKVYHSGFCPVCNRNIENTESSHYHDVEVGEDKILFKERSDVAALRKELATFLKGIKVDRVEDEYVIDQPPVDWDKIRAYYNKGDKRLHFKDEDTLKRFIGYAWGLEKIKLVGETKMIQQTSEDTYYPEDSRLKAFKRVLKDEQ